jgi:hypothetical protein
MKLILPAGHENVLLMQGCNTYTYCHNSTGMRSAVRPLIYQYKKLDFKVKFSDGF